MTAGATTHQTPPENVKDRAAGPNAKRPRKLQHALSPRTIGAIYVWVLMVIAFSIIEPDVFPTTTTVQGITSQYAIPGLAAMAIIIALSCGAFDLTIGANIGLSGMVFAVVVGDGGGTPVGVALALALLVGLAVGLANILVVVVCKIDSFIGTLAMAAMLTACATALSGGEFKSVTVDGVWNDVATGSFMGLQLPFYYLLVLTVVLGLWLERTTAGRYAYATGFDAETARLTGLPVARLRATGYLVSGVLGAFTGVLYTTMIASSTPGGGDAFLLPAFSAAFLGATQIRPGRFNTWGALVAVLLVATGDYGITILGGAQWTTQLFQGIVLIVAIGLGTVGGQRLMGQRRGRRPSWPSRRRTTTTVDEGMPA